MSLGGTRKVVPGKDYSTSGAPNISGLFPSLKNEANPNGRLYASHLYGKKRGFDSNGARDLSRNGRHADLSTITEERMFDTYFKGTSVGRAVMPFTNTALLAAGGYTVFWVGRQDAAASSCNPFSATDAAPGPYYGEVVALRTGGNTFWAVVQNAAGQNAAINPALDDAADGAWTLYGVAFSGTTIKKYARNSAMVAAQISAPVAHTRPVGLGRAIWIGGGRDGTAGGEIDIKADGFYPGVLTDAEMNAVFDAVKAGLARRGEAL